MKSLHTLIRVSALTLMAGLVATFSVLVYIGGDSLLRQYVDGRLLGLAETLAQLIERRPDLIESGAEELVPAQEPGQTPEERHELREVAHSVLIFATDGHLVWKGSDVGPRGRLPETFVDQVQRKPAVFETVRHPDGASVRRVSIQIPRHGEMRYILQAEASLLFSQKTLQGLIVLLTVGSIAILLMAWLSSRWLAGKILTPLRLLGASAETISEADLSARLTLDSPFVEFQRLTTAFNAVMDRFQRACNSQRQFVDYAAHEMQTPLTVLQGNLEVTLQKARTPEEYREALLSNLEQVERLITLTRSLLVLTKFAGERPPVRLAPVALGPLVQNLVSELRVLADDRGIALRFEGQLVPEIRGDPQWLQQALVNLLDNALRYTASGGTVTVRLERVANQVAIRVEDTGQGIEAEHLPHLFERFYRTDWARARDSGGTGLGLPIVKEIVEAHHGSVTVQSHVGSGSIFTLWLPIPAGPLA